MKPCSMKQCNRECERQSKESPDYYIELCQKFEKEHDGESIDESDSNNGIDPDAPTEVVQSIVGRLHESDAKNEVGDCIFKTG